MVLANITTPLVGLVDTAVLGHMDSPAKLAGASVATIIITQLIWVCGFLRMSATGLSAQAWGEDNLSKQSSVLWQSGFIALGLALLLVICQLPIFHLGMQLSALEGTALQAAEVYFFTRIWGLPAAFLNLALIGWMIGRQFTRQVLVIQVLGNVINVSLNLLFVFVMQWDVAGVAIATVIAELTMCLMAASLCYRATHSELPTKAWFSFRQLRQLFSLNANMFLRNLVLQLCLAFLTLQGARYGVTAAAINAMLLQFFALIALGLDGIAYAVEALVGKAKGAGNRQLLRQHIYLGMGWSLLIAGSYALIFALFTLPIAATITTHGSVIEQVHEFVWIIVLLPLVGHWCFLFDGVAIGLTRAQAMRNSMFFSAALGFFPTWWLFSSLGNVALWLAVLAFLLARGVTLGWIIYRDHLASNNLNQTI